LIRGSVFTFSLFLYYLIHITMLSSRISRAVRLPSFPSGKPSKF
jgi:hypothetical protein